MQRSVTPLAIILGLSILSGLTALGYLLGDAAIRYKQFERSVTVKGLSEREYKADIALWPIQFSAAANQLDTLYTSLESHTDKIRSFLLLNGIHPDEISIASPAITDKSAQTYGSNSRPEFRYSALQTVTVYSTNIEVVRNVMKKLSSLGREGIVFTGGDYQAQTEYLFTRLNEVKPEMVEEATRQAREVAEKFATDSDSKLGKIKRASQGQFSISNRDRNTPHIKRVRVVSTVEYYLSD
ncbi:SIMPL domain-containing protein [Neptuniibacter halophilus]|uniref:SIMPL domain-containing protein n=1 Tax=Neptuniibacter halophilus TaxID=651666 RepID=UPI002572BF40|nr:SIMPL domain-containing protein [Neptuniibacter halophilus]